MTTDHAAIAADRRTSVLMLLTNTYDPDPRVRQEARALLGMNCKVRILAWDRDHKHPSDEIVEGVVVERIHLRSRHGRGTTQLFFYALLYLRFFWRGWKTQFDVIHCHDLDTLPVGFLLGKLKRKPVVFDAHESFVGMIENSVHPYICGILRRLENFLIRRTDLLITVGEKLRRHFEERGAKHAVVIGNWKDPAEYARTPQENLLLRAEHGVPQGAVLISCITQLLKNRHIEEMMDAIEGLPDVYFLVAGRGALEPILKERAKRDSHIIFPGFLHASQVAAFTCASDAIYCGFDPANSNERFAAPNKLFEALAAGKPIITPDAGEIAEVTRAANCGIVTPDCSAGSLRQAVELLRDPHRREELSANSRALGLREMNWTMGRRILFEEYCRLRPEMSTSGVTKLAPAANP